MTDADHDTFDHLDEFADGDVSTEDFADGRPTELICDPVEAPTLVEAVADVARRIRLIPGLRAVAARHDDMVTLGEAAQRSGRTRTSLDLLASGKRGPGGFPAPEWTTPGTSFYSWAKITAFLVSLGDEVEETSLEIVLADSLLRVAHEVENRKVHVTVEVLADLGLPVAV
ncbi:hypothetical protein [Kitasatospora sp. MAA4]|uniref:hypothetical protein n=1 Tax=Kitasatospora sp. MAA4 TaxID=3035093 RepID=UPI002474818C|nr:hypothetical protein [Kitasatospora sp. MAA4]